MGVFFDIESALQKKLNSVVNHPRIVWENDVDYKPILGTRYWRPTNLPLKSELASTGALQKHQGIYQIDVFATANKGVAAIMDDLDSIYTAFNSVISLDVNGTRVDILQIGRGRVVQEASWCRGYIEISYMCYSH
jgi:hypothetical protein